MEMAFAPGYDPALELLTHANRVKAKDEDTSIAIDELELGELGASSWTDFLRRKEQSILEKIVWGHETGHYFMLLGPKVR